MKPEHLDLLRIPGRPSANPDGSFAVVAITRPDLDDDAYRSRLWRFDLTDTTAPPLALTAGPRDSEPVLSPDGRWIAFLRAGESGPSQLAVLDVRGGEPVVLTEHVLGVTGRPAWSPDSSRLAYTARLPEEGRYGSAEGVGPDAEPARRITTFTYRRDGVGFSIGRPAQVFVLDVPPPADPTAGPAMPRAPFRLTEGEVSHAGIVWEPSGTAVLALRERPDALVGDLVRLALPEIVDVDDDIAPEVDVAAPDQDDRRHGIKIPVQEAVVPLEVLAPGDGASTRLTVDAVAFAVPVPAIGPVPDDGEEPAAGEILLLARNLGADGLDFVGRNPALFRARLAGTELTQAERLTDPEIDDLLGGVGPGGFEVLEDGSVLLRRTRRGRTELVRVTRDGLIDVVHSGSVTGAAALPDGRIVASATLQDSPGEVLLIEPATLDAAGENGVTRLTDLAAPLRSAVGGAFRVPTEVAGAAAPDGTPVHGWVVTPDPAVHGDGPYPTLLLIHGGPYAAYEDVFFDEVAVATGAGYAVVYGNLRGSAGYGTEHGRAILEGFGTVDADDVLALLDRALETRPELDARRVGVMGGSYGGYMAAWLTTRDDAARRFRGAIVERGFLDPVSFQGSSDIGWYFGLRYLGDDATAVAAQSPMAHLDKVTTPTLVIHSEQDWRCPVEQGQRWYVGLRRRGVPTELLLFPGEGHELSRSGRPQHRRQRFEAVLDWWERQIPAVPLRLVR